MVGSYTIDLKILFKRFFCPVCGEKLKVEMTSRRLMPNEQSRHYRQLYPHGIPMRLDVSEMSQIFVCPKCNYKNTTLNQLSIRKKQKKLKKKILDEND